MPNCILVLGTARTGTSVTAGILHHLGVDLGCESHDEKPAHNSKGLFRCRLFDSFFDGIHTFYMNTDGSVLQAGTLSIDERTQKVRDYIKERSTPDVDWGMKSVYTQYVLQEFIGHSPHPIKLLVTNRDLAKSVESYDKWWPGQSSEFMLSNIAKAIDFRVAASGLPSLTVNFDDLIDNREKAVTAIAEFIGRPITQEAIDFVDPSMKSIY
jgi:hypothetical protein